MCVYIYVCVYVYIQMYRRRNILRKNWCFFIEYLYDFIIYIKSSTVKQLLETLLLAIKMCTAFTTFLHFGCVPIYIFAIHHKRCASDEKDFTLMKFIINQIFVALMNAWRTKRVCYYSEMVRWWHFTLFIHILSVMWSQCTSLWWRAEFLKVA